jgi:ornithine cyclodeaminase/alanine dehydrogenase-like protein (mu-crystallin family)
MGLRWNRLADTRINSITPRRGKSFFARPSPDYASSVIPFLTTENVLAAVSPERAVEAVRDGFVAFAKDEWSMPPKVYLPAYPAGDFRAMPAIGAGHAVLKWVTSFPGNPEKGLPTVKAIVLVSDAETGLLVAVLEGSALTALRTGAAAVLAAETLSRPDAETVAVIGAGVNGKATARTFLARGREVILWDLDPERTRAAAGELGARVAADREQALSADIVATVTPAYEPLIAESSLLPGQHVSLMGADGPGKCEIAPRELARTHVFCDDWTQASHAGELQHLVPENLIGREQVTQLGEVLANFAPGRTSAEEITTFDSTGLAIQDLALALAVLERVGKLEGVLELPL